MDLPEIDLLMDPTGALVVQVEEETNYTDLSELVAAVPALVEPAHAETAAEAVNHLAGGYDYELILDPDGFRSEFYAKYDAEADEPPVAGEPKLRDFGRPDLSVVAEPQSADGVLIFFARDVILGIAYRVAYTFGDVDADYRPIKGVPGG